MSKQKIIYIKGPQDSQLNFTPNTVSGGFGIDGDNNPKTQAAGVPFDATIPAGLSTYCRKAIVSNTEFNVKIGDKSFRLKLAEDVTEGLSNTEKLDSGTGMLFDLQSERSKIPINMQEMKYPLDIIFITESDKVTKILRNLIPGIDVTYSGEPARYFIEVNSSDSSGIESGDILKIKDNKIEKSFQKEHQTAPPYPGEIFDDIKHRWVQPETIGVKIADQGMSNHLKDMHDQLSFIHENALRFNQFGPTQKIAFSEVLVNCYKLLAKLSNQMYDEVKAKKQELGVPLYTTQNPQNPMNRARSHLKEALKAIRDNQPLLVSKYLSTFANDYDEALQKYEEGARARIQKSYLLKELNSIIETGQKVIFDKQDLDFFNQQASPSRKEAFNEVFKQEYGTMSSTFNATAGGAGTPEIDFYSRKKLKDKIDSLLSKSREYLSPGEQPPKNTPVQVSARGARFYEASRNFEDKNKVKFERPKVLITPSGIKVPPGWNNVWITTSKTSSLQARGVDSVGRQTYLHSKEFDALGIAKKWKRQEAFNKVYDILQKRIDSDAKKSEEALVLSIILRTGFRIGSEQEHIAKVKAYGACTLQKEHAKVSGNTIHFKFPAKKGTLGEDTITDPLIALKIREKLAGKNSRLFNTTDYKVRKYLHSLPGGAKFKNKDFRTWIGTAVAIRAIEDIPLPKTLKEYKKAKNLVGDAVSKKLCNTKNVALKSYINPAVWDDFLISLKQNGVNIDKL